MEPQTLVDQTDPTGFQEVPAAKEIQQPEDFLSMELQQDVAQVLTPVAMFGVVVLWALNMKRGRAAASAIDGIIGAFAAARSPRKQTAKEPDVHP